MNTGLSRRLAAPAALALLTACGDLTSTGPVAETQYQWFAAGYTLSCGVRGGTPSCSDPYGSLETLAPVAVPAEVRELALGEAHACALAENDTAWCWGADQALVGRQSGNPETPAPVSGDQRFSSLSASVWRTCGLATDGSVWCWGWGYDGPVFGWSVPLGEACPSEFECLLPTPMPTELRFTDLGTGLDHGCGLTSAGVAWCWGLNTSGQLGTGQVAPSSTCEEVPCRLPPTRIATSTRFEQLAVTDIGACGLTSDGEAWCWGGGSGEPSPIAGHHLTTLTGGTQICALDDARQAWCWLPAGAAAALDDASLYAPRRVPSLSFDRIFPSPGGFGCGWNGVTGAACWSGLDGEPEIVPGQL